MPQILDIFNGDAFSTAYLSRSIGVIPRQFGRIGELNLFPDVGIPTLSVAIELNVGVSNLLQTARRGAPGTVGLRDRRNIRDFRAVHIPHDTELTKDELLKRRGADGQIGQTTAAAMIAAEQRAHRRKHDITREHLRAGALRGVVLDADGSTILNLFTEFGVAETAFNFDFATAGGDLRIVSLKVATHIDDNLDGETRTGIRALCSQSFFERFVGHESVKRAWDNHQSASDRLSSDPRAGFAFGGISYEQYTGKGSFREEDGTSTVREFIPEGDARFMPEGMQNSAATFNAPSDLLDEEVGNDGQAFYARVMPRPDGRALKVHSQQNPIPICIRPQLLVRGFSST